MRRPRTRLAIRNDAWHSIAKKKGKLIKRIYGSAQVKQHTGVFRIYTMNSTEYELRAAYF